MMVMKSKLISVKNYIEYIPKSNALYNLREHTTDQIIAMIMDIARENQILSHIMSHVRNKLRSNLNCEYLPLTSFSLNGSTFIGVEKIFRDEN